MPRKCETPLAGGASRNSCAGRFRDPLTLTTNVPQAIPDLIARHIGEQFIRRSIEGGDHG